MNNSTYNNINYSDEITSHLPRSLQLMIFIEEKANDGVNAILNEIAAGKTTLEDVKRKRGI
nr:hypothetical protein [uncultured Methanolobus sp.]